MFITEFNANVHYTDHYSTVVCIVGHYTLKYFQTSHTQRVERELQVRGSVIYSMSIGQQFKCVNSVATRHRINNSQETT